jgi:membrane-bound lytic murein transglycosylase A
MRIGYAGQNGREYVAIGKLLRDRGILPPGGASMESIKAWIRANPDAGRELMRENLSYIFFKPLTGPGPLGALNVPVTPRASVAADPKYVPLGAPIFIHHADRHLIDGIWVAQDTGGAIKGANRFDTFWGAGPEAVEIAGGMSSNAEALILIPKGTAARALAQP